LFHNHSAESCCVVEAYVIFYPLKTTGSVSSNPTVSTKHLVCPRSKCLFPPLPEVREGQMDLLTQIFIGISLSMDNSAVSLAIDTATKESHTCAQHSSMGSVLAFLGRYDSAWVGSGNTAHCSCCQI
jgi:hypothetical protein